MILGFAQERKDYLKTANDNALPGQMSGLATVQVNHGNAPLSNEAVQGLYISEYLGRGKADAGTGL